jgi:hypothetical protein
MNAERLRRLVDLLIAEDSASGAQQHLQELREALAQLQNSPGDTNAQALVVQRMDRLENLVEIVDRRLSPQDRALVADLGGERFFTTMMVEEIKSSIAANAMTPAMVHRFVEQLQGERGQFLANLGQASHGLASLGIAPETLAPGDAEMDVLIPRSIFHNRLDQLSKELSTLNQIINVFAEVRTGKTDSVEIRQISTTDPLFSLAFDPKTMVMIGATITWLLNTWKQALEIKKLRGETAKSPVFSEADLKIFDDKIEQHVAARIEQRVEELLGAGARAAGRQNELDGLLRWSMRELLARIERGMTIEIRFLPLRSQR